MSFGVITHGLGGIILCRLISIINQEDIFMPTGYHHLAYEQRCQLAALRAAGTSQKAIAKQLNCSESTVSRELSRNTGKRGYRFKQAQEQYNERRHAASSKITVMTDEMIDKVIDKLQKGWSPDQISGRLKKEGLSISHETIYQFVWKEKRKGGELYKYLRHSGKKYNKRSSKNSGRGCIANRVDIEERPKIVESKSRIGDWEGDTIIGAKHQGALATYVDRKSKYLIMCKLPNKESEVTKSRTIEAFTPIKRRVKTITYDNGKEFSKHEAIAAALDAKCYFAKPYHSWERGLNEHTNGLIREYFPKDTNFNEVTEREVEIVMNKINNRPRKVLGYKTPREVFMRELREAEIIALHT